MPPFVGYNVFFTDGSTTITVPNGEGTVEVEGEWVVVTVGNKTTSYPANRVKYVQQSRS